MILRMVSSALCHQRRDILFPVPPAEPFWTKTAGIRPQPVVMASAVDVEDHPILVFESMPTPGKRFVHAAGNHREERVVAAHFLYERFKVRFVTAGRCLTPLWVFFQRYRSECNEPRDCHGGTQNIDEFHCRDF